MSIKKPNIGILTFPISESGNIPLSNLVDILCSLSNDLYLITGNDGYIFFEDDKRIQTCGIRHERGTNVFTRILRYIYTQLRISYKLARVAKKVDLWIFFISGNTLLLPMLTAKLLREKVVLASTGNTIEALRCANDNLYKPIEILSKINYILSDRIIIYSKSIINDLNLEKYRNKICIAHKHFLDFETFKIKKQLDKRDNFVGQIGRLCTDEGTLNFVKAIPEILKERPELKFLIVGEGPLRGEIERYLEEKNLNSKVKLTGWAPHDDIPNYLNELKLLVLPSYQEGIPNIVLEAMACGTPVVATPVGGVPDFIKDEDTGFIMENNNPECVVENLIRALNYPNLDKIVKNARELVEKEFTYEAAVERYRKILESF